MIDDPYEVLGVTDPVTPAELKRAWLRKIREHPPETDPEGFQRVQRAYETAKDPDYPTLRKYGAEVESLLGEARGFMEAENWADAARRYKRVLVLHPESFAARNSLGICHTRAGEWDDAKRVYAKLIGQKPEVVLYRVNYTWVFINQANSISGHPPEVRQLATEGREVIDPALQLEPNNPDVLDAYSRTFGAEADWPRAIEWAERAINARTGMPDLDELFRLAFLYSHSNRRGDLPRLADRVGGRLSADDREVLARRLGVKAQESYDAHNFAPAVAAAVLAAALDPNADDIVAAARRWETAAAASDEYDLLANDSAVIPPMSALCAILSDQSRNVDTDTPIDQMLDRVWDAMKTWDLSEVQAAAKRVQSAYPNMYALRTELFDQLAGGPPPRRASRTTTPPSRSRTPPPPPAPPKARLLDTPRPSERPSRRASPPSRRDRDDEPMREPHRGGAILALGILGLCCCILPLFAIPMAVSDLNKMNDGRMDPSGKGLTVAGLVCAVIAICLQLLSLFIKLNSK